MAVNKGDFLSSDPSESSCFRQVSRELQAELGHNLAHPLPWSLATNLPLLPGSTLREGSPDIVLGAFQNSHRPGRS